jgi:hypothetical protein
MIFLSHNHADKLLVEPIALGLRNVFGQDQVFYDSWAIQPGDGIVDKVNSALACCRVFFIFISKRSLTSGMVRIEWQSAIMRLASGAVRIIPVRLEPCDIPPILGQFLYIDLFTNGLEPALRQAVDVVYGCNSFWPIHKTQPNLKAVVFPGVPTTVVECRAQWYMEPVSHYLYLLDHGEGELSFEYKSGAICTMGYHDAVQLSDGSVYGAQQLSVERATSPGFPVAIAITLKSACPLRLVGVMHEHVRGQWKSIPMRVEAPKT